MTERSTVQAKRKTKVGRVVSDRMDKTIVVSVERLARHPLYKRVIRLTSKFKAHDETNTARTGDTVLIEESRPLSATKRWRTQSWPTPPGFEAERALIGRSLPSRRRSRLLTMYKYWLSLNCVSSSKPAKCASVPW